MNKTILLVDDDAAFRESVRDTLEIEGYTVIEFEDGKDALPVIKNQLIDLVITDILMPGMEGVQLAIEIKKIKPGLMVIGMTGGGRIMVADKVKSYCSSAFFKAVLKKPFLGEELIHQVEDALT